MEILKSFAHPDEVMALLRFKFGGCEVVMPKCDFGTMSPTLKRCYEFLNMTSRSFSAVIQALDGELRDAVCIFYLVLRALDTVEDDMTIPTPIKVPMLKSFYKNLWDPDWNYTESNDKDRIVLENFPSISKEFRSLAEIYREVISDICRKMGDGMTVFLERKVDTMEEWDEYCHYVAGLVGIGLAKLFSASGQEDAIIGEDSSLANKLGLFLQKTNIIRDYLEDWNDKRIFWPRAAWSKYASDLGEFAQPQHQEKAVQCLNELITNTLELLPSTVLFMSRLKTQSIFNFVAIPQKLAISFRSDTFEFSKPFLSLSGTTKLQLLADLSSLQVEPRTVVVMAVATLERCYNNPKVFSGVVKIRKGEAVRIMMGSTSLEKVKAIMRHFTLQIIDRIPDSDPNAIKTRAVCQKALEDTETQQEYTTSTIYPPLYMSMGLMLTAIAYTYWSQILQLYDDLF